MSTSTTMSVSDAIDAAKAGQRVVVICPAHDDSSPSLAVAPGNSQPVLLTCHAGCEREAILAAAGIEWADVCNDDALDALATGVDNWTPAGKASHIYPYLDEQGKKLFEVLRTPTDGGGKTFFQRKIDPKEPRGYVWKMDNVRRVPYRLPHLLLAINEGQRCHIVEGEKCVHALLRKVPEGEAVTTNPGGAGKWQEEWGQWFAGATVDIYADGDDTGRQHARAVRESIVKYGGRARILEAPTHHDVADHLAAGLSLDDLLETTPESMAEKARTGVDILEMLKRKILPTEWAINGTLAKGERLLVVGLEGHGKSTLLRQIAVCVAAGIHPFDGRDIPPRRVLMIDAENHPSQVRESYADLVGLAARHGLEMQPGMLHLLEEWDAKHDLTTVSGKAWLEERFYAYRPELVLVGPLTNVVGKDLKHYEPVDMLRDTIDASRRICNSAIIMEHHAPKRGNGDKVREVTAYGSGLFLKWPDFGFAMVPSDHPDHVGTYIWEPMRGPRVRGRSWPMALRTGKPNTDEFPWEQCERPPSASKGR